MRQRKVLLPLLLWSGLVLGVAWTWIQFGDSKVATVLSILSTFAALLALWQSGLQPLLTGRPSTREQIDQAAEMLVVEVRKQWEEEARRRRLQEAQQMPIRWQVDRRGRQVPEPQTASGELAALVDEFTTRPRPMMVIGEPGSGKTGLCVILTVELLREVSRDRVPVLMQVSSWDPEDNFDAWLGRRLLEDYPFLGNESRFGTTAVGELVAQRRVLPILDGLDELPEELRERALAAIGEDWSAERPFVLTSRTREFEAIRAVNVAPRALVVRLLPLEQDAAAAYLRDAAADLDLDRWNPVLTSLGAEPDAALARTLTKPLMLFLARTAYETPDTTPAELLDQRRFGDPTAIEEHLLDRFLPTVYASRPPPPRPSPTRPSRKWNPDVARETLAFLATHLDQTGTRDLAWWRLPSAVPRMVFLVVRIIVGWVICALLGLLFFGLFGRPLLGVAFGSAVGVLGAAPLGAIREKKPRRFVPRLLRRTELTPEFLVRDIGFAVVGLLVGGLIVGLIFGRGYGVAIGMVFGLVFGLVRRFTEPTESKEPVSPIGVLRSDRVAVLSAAALGGLVGAMVGGFLGGVVGAREYGLILTLPPVQEGLLGAGSGLLLGSAGLGMMTYTTSAAGQFLTTRIWLAARGRTPLRLMLFLQDAHKLGVLRQIGSVYQFRHALLQDRLAGRRTTPAGATDVKSPNQTR